MPAAVLATPRPNPLLYDDGQDANNPDAAGKHGQKKIYLPMKARRNKGLLMPTIRTVGSDASAWHG